MSMFLQNYFSLLHYDKTHSLTHHDSYYMPRKLTTLMIMIFFI